MRKTFSDLRGAAIKSSQSILIVDPEDEFLGWAARHLETPGTRIATATTAEEGFAVYQRERPNLLVSEMNLHSYSGLELLSRVRTLDPGAMVILTSASGKTETIIESMKRGAFDFLRKELSRSHLKVLADAALHAQAETRAAKAFKPRLPVEEQEESLVGKSEAMQQVFKMIGRVSHSDAPVMVTGESGSGKELVARAIHRHSRRSDKSFVAINCAAIPDQLLESELFGHEKGAFTGAIAQRPGRFEQSDGGTLFLDEIGDMPLVLQGKILRVLQEGEFSRVGANAVLRADVRVIAATNRNLEKDVARNRFREDLFYRLNVVRIELPPLRRRVEDIRLLAEYFLRKAAAKRGTPRLKLSKEAVEALEGHSWPGNVRELENTILRASVMAAADLLLPRDILLGRRAMIEANPVEAGEEGGDELARLLETTFQMLVKTAQEDPTVRILPRLEREFMQCAIRRTQGNRMKAAKLLGITRSVMRTKIERLGLGGEVSNLELDRQESAI